MQSDRDSLGPADGRNGMLCERRKMLGGFVRKMRSSRRKRKGKAKIELAVATDGSMGGENPSQLLVKKRKLETQKGLSKIGIPHFLNLPDGKLHDCNYAGDAISSYLLKIRPDIILTHDPEDYCKIELDCNHEP